MDESKADRLLNIESGPEATAREQSERGEQCRK